MNKENNPKQNNRSKSKDLKTKKINQTLAKIKENNPQLVNNSSQNNKKATNISKQSKARKFTSVNKEKEQLPKYTAINNKLQEIYLNCRVNANNNWKFDFKNLFEKEKIIDFSASNFIPVSYNLTGSYILKNEKLWFIWLELTKKYLNSLESLVTFVNSALDFIELDDINNITSKKRNEPKAILTKFNDIIKANFREEDVIKYCQSSGKVHLEITGSYNYLLDHIVLSNINSSVKKSFDKFTISEISREEDSARNRPSGTTSLYPLKSHEQLINKIETWKDSARKEFIASDCKSLEKIDSQINELTKSLEKIRTRTENPGLELLAGLEKSHIGNILNNLPYTLEKPKTIEVVTSNNCDISFAPRDVSENSPSAQDSNEDFIISSKSFSKKVDSVNISVGKFVYHSDKSAEGNDTPNSEEAKNEDEGPIRDKTRISRSYTKSRSKSKSKSRSKIYN
jgi:hypothetical protein